MKEYFEFSPLLNSSVHTVQCGKSLSKTNVSTVVGFNLFLMAVTEFPAALLAIITDGMRKYEGNPYRRYASSK